MLLIEINIKIPSRQFSEIAAEMLVIDLKVEPCYKTFSCYMKVFYFCLFWLSFITQAAQTLHLRDCVGPVAVSQGSTPRPMNFSFVCVSKGILKFLRVEIRLTLAQYSSQQLTSSPVGSWLILQLLALCNHNLACNFNAIWSSANIQMSNMIRLIYL